MTTFLRHRALAVATLAFLLAAAVAAGLAFAGTTLLGERRVAIPLLVALIGTGVVALLGWAAERRRGEELAESHAEERARFEAERTLIEADAKAAESRLLAELSAARAGFDSDRAARDEVEGDLRARLEGLERALPETAAEYEARLDRANEDLLEERRRAARGEDARRTERRWTEQLRGQLGRIARERGPLGESAGVPANVLPTAMGLLGAEKGILMRRGNDARLAVVCHEGFTADPAESGIAARAAREAVDTGRPVRVEDEDRLNGAGTAPADAEIAQLLAVPLAGDQGALLLANRAGGFDAHPDDVLLALGGTVAHALEDAEAREELRDAFLSTVAVLAEAIEAKDRSLLVHARTTAAYVAAVADRIGLEPRRRDELLYAALLHDVGKIAISERILMKPAELTPEERRTCQLHPRVGALLVAQVPVLRTIEAAVLHHHERWDGGGYPDGLAGEEIPVEARIVAVADAFSSMTSDRPYRRRRSLEEACEELERCSATQFDPLVVRLFVEEVRRRPPTLGGPDVLDRVFADPELVRERREGEPLLGSGALALAKALTLL
jgi:HD-GYP domain-containing protein (c-di-GMP phosphodiesterase class II)